MRSLRDLQQRADARRGDLSAQERVVGKGYGEVEWEDEGTESRTA